MRMTVKKSSCVFQPHLTEILLYVVINDIHHGLNVNTYSSNIPSC